MTTDYNTKLSAHFTLGEMLRSGIAIKHNIDNTPHDERVVEALKLLCQYPLEDLRRRFGRIIVTSGYRCEQLNRFVKGAKRSQHLLGEAADIYVSGNDMAKRYADLLEKTGHFDQLIFEPRGQRTTRWLHVSYTLRHNNRRQVLR